MRGVCVFIGAMKINHREHETSIALNKISNTKR